MSFIYPNLTDDLLTEILLRLPLKQILRCKSVAKPWLSLISSPSFVKSHLAIAIEIAKANETLIVNCDDDSDDSIALVDLASRQIVHHLNFPHSQSHEAVVNQGDVSDPSVILINATTFERLAELNVPIFENQSDCMSESLIIGSACGIVCVRSTSGNIYLWNPATKHSKLIPSPMLHDCGILRSSLGFGFDELDNDFKVVRVVLPFLYSEVYSTNTNVWRLVEDRPIDFPGVNNDFEVCVNGFLCSVGSRHGMMTFDLNREVFNCSIKLTVTTFGTSFDDIKDSKADARMTEFNESIAVIIDKKSENNCKINLWMLDDKACFRGGGIEASWTLMLNIDVNLPVAFVHGHFNNGDLLLLDDDGDWCLYNSVTKDVKDFAGSFLLGQMFKYTESLVSIPRAM